MTTSTTFLGRCWNARLEPTASPDAQRFLPALHCLRGFAAFSVLLEHAIDMQGMAPPLLAYFGYGRVSVLVFFVISGFVIGHRHREAPTAPAIRRYLYSRARRILPIYFVAVAFSILALVLTHHAPSLRQTIAHLLLLQTFEWIGSFAPTIFASNGPLWTISLEAIYYLLFLGLWSIRPRFGPLILGIATAAIASAALLSGGIHFLSTLLTGLLFWVGGVALAWFVQPAKQSGDFPLLACLCLLASLELANPLTFALAHLGWSPASLPWLNVADWVILPLALLLVAGTTGRIGSLRPLVIACAITPGALALVALVVAGKNFLEPRWAFAALLFLVGAWQLRTPSSQALARFAALGTISYALYAIHFPINYLVLAFLPWGWFGQACVSIFLSLALAWALERKFQPECLRLFRARATA